MEQATGDGEKDPAVQNQTVGRPRVTTRSAP